MRTETQANPFHHEVHEDHEGSVNQPPLRELRALRGDKHATYAFVGSGDRVEVVELHLTGDLAALLSSNYFHYGNSCPSCLAL